MNKSIKLLAAVLVVLQGCVPGSSPTERKTVLADSTSFYIVSVEYPEESRDKAQVMKAFVEERYAAKREDWKTGGAIQQEEEKITRTFPERAAIKYSYDLEFERFTSDSLNTVSYLFTNYEYTGGANGNLYVNTYSFSADNRQLVIEDILDFSENRDIELSRLLAQTALSDTSLFFKDFVEAGLGIAYLKKDGVALDHEKCRCDGFFFGSNFQNFVLRNEGITFYFDKYAIAPGAAGITQVTLTWDALRPYLKTPQPF